MPIEIVNKDSRLARQIINSFNGGINDSTDPIKLNEDEFQYIQNAVLYANNGVKSLVARNGFTKYNANNPASATATKIIQLFEYRKNDGTNYLVIKTNSSLERTSSGTPTGTFNNIEDTDGITQKVNFIQAKDFLYIINRNNGTTYYVNKFYDGTNYFDFGIVPCNITGLSVVAGYGDFNIWGTPANYFVDGWRSYIITYLYDDNTESDIVLSGIALSVLATGVLGAKGVLIANTPVSHLYCTLITLDNIPTGNARVTARKIYRTKANGNEYYYLGIISDNTTTKYTDVVFDDSNLTEILDLKTIFKPQIATSGTAHKRRLFIGNLKDNLTLTNNITIASSSVSSDTITDFTGIPTQVNTDLKLFYKLCRMYNHSIPPFNSVSMKGDLGTSYQATLTKSGSIFYRRVTLTLNSYTWTENYNAYIGVYRCPSLAIFDVSVVDSTHYKLRCYIWYTKDKELSTPITTGDVINIYGITGGGITLPDGDYTVTSTSYNAGFIVINIVVSSTTGTTSDNNTGGLYVKDRYYYVGCLNNGDTQFIDSVFDPFASQRFFDEHATIIKLSANKNYPQTFIWSDVDKPEYFPPENIDVLSNETGNINAMFSEDDGVIIFKDNSIYKLFTSASSSAYWVTKKLVDNIGCSNPQTIVQFNTNKYCWYQNNKFYIWQSGFNDPIECSIPIKSHISGVNYTINGSAYYNKFNWVVFTTDTITFVLDLNFIKEGKYIWYIFYKNTFASTQPELSLQVPFVDRAGNLLFGSLFNYIYQYGLNDYTDSLYSSGTPVTADIHLQLLTKMFDTYFNDVTRIETKYYSAGTGTNKLTITPKKDTSNGTVTTKSIATGYNRISVPMNIQYCKQFEIFINASISAQFYLQILSFDFRTLHEEAGIGN